MRPYPEFNGIDKKCSSCQIIKPIEQFNKSKLCPHGYSYNCKDCNKKFKQDHPEYNKLAGEKRKLKRKTDTDYREKLRKEKVESSRRNIKQNMVSRAKKRALLKGLQFDISKEDLEVPDICPILKIPLIIGTKGNYENTPSIDRIDNTRGYTKDNIQIITKKANSMKNSGTPEELLKLADWIYKTFKN